VHRINAKSHRLSVGAYLVSIDEAEWRRQREQSPVSLAARVESALAARRYPTGPFGTAPFTFEEKLYRDLGAFNRLVCDELGEHDGRDGEPPAFVGAAAEIFVPIPFAGLIIADGPGVYDPEGLVIASSHTLLKQAQRLAASIDLCPDIPAGKNLEIGLWFDEYDDDNAAFYVALFLRAAEHSVAHRVPLVFT
jgi:hypothetical protein